MRYIFTRVVALTVLMFSIFVVQNALVGAIIHANSLSAEQIIDKVDENAYKESSYARMTMTIVQGNRKLIKEMITWGDGDGNGLVEFVNPADRGTKYLKLNDELWMFFPDADDLVKISGHMLRQGFMGSDFSYEDALESEPLQSLYDFTLETTESCNDRQCYVLTATSHPHTRVTYATRRMWIDTELFVIRKEELYASGGRLLKKLRTEDIIEIEGRHVATKLTMEDVLRTNSSTTMIMDELQFDVDIPDGLFSLRSLMR